MNELPVVWYYLLAFVSIFGVLTWILDKFSNKDNLKKISAILGVISMLSLLYVTYTTEGI
tara:strand:- start:267 stop:446 length:180 start_codon:yes stop_codon:yes gene_type:complete